MTEYPPHLVTACASDSTCVLYICQYYEYKKLRKVQRLIWTTRLTVTFWRHDAKVTSSFVIYAVLVLQVVRKL